MMRIFIVEDEVSALQALEQKIKDIDGSYEVVGTASNGRQALDLIVKSNPSLIITDIQMPDMDGLEMLKELRRRDIQALTVIITGYQKFDYAKQALKLGAADYLLKPVSPVDLEECLKKCRGELRKRIHSQNAISFFIGDNSISLDGVSFEDGCVVNYFIMGNTIESFNSILHPNIPYLPPIEVEAMLKPFLPEEVTSICLDGMRANEKALILTGKEITTQEWNECFTAFGKKISDTYGTFVTQFYSCGDDPQNIGGSIHSCRKHGSMSIQLGKSQVLAQVIPSSIQPINPTQYVEIFVPLLRRQQHKALMDNITTMLEEWSVQKFSLMVIQSNLSLLLNELYLSLSSSAGDFFDSEFHIENIICFAEDNKGLEESFYQLLLELFVKPMQTEKTVAVETLVQRVEDYFAQNLSKNITLQMLTDEIDVSRAYLCRVFKRVTDTTPMDYFTQMKIARAKEMILAMPDVPLWEISDTLGFNDTYYFSKVFKRVTGFPPSELREKS